MSFKVIKDSIYELGLVSTAHGIPSILRSQRLFHKLMWVFFTLASFSVCCWFINDILIKYTSYSVVTNIESIFQQPAQFPTVSICSRENIFEKNTLQQLIRRCWFNFDESCKNDPNNFFVLFYDTDYGKCYRFNSGKNVSGDLVPILNSTIGGMDDSFVFEINTSKELAVWIHNSSTPPKREFMNNYYGENSFASAGSFSHFIVEKQIDTKLGEPYNSCFKDIDSFKLNKTLVNYIKTKKEIYNQVYCLKICFDLDYITNNPCNCTNGTLGNVWQNCFVYNSKPESKGCTMNYKKSFFTKKVLTTCSDYCPLECDTISFTVSVNSFFDQANRTTIYVYYKDLKFISINQEASMVMSDLVSNIGGILGLFIGISFLSFIEIFEVISEVCFVLFSNHENNKIKIIKVNK